MPTHIALQSRFRNIILADVKCAVFQALCDICSCCSEVRGNAECRLCAFLFNTRAFPRKRLAWWYRLCSFEIPANKHPRRRCPRAPSLRSLAKRLVVGRHWNEGVFLPKKNKALPVRHAALFNESEYWQRTESSECLRMARACLGYRRLGSTNCTWHAVLVIARSAFNQSCHRYGTLNLNMSNSALLANSITKWRYGS